MKSPSSKPVYEKSYPSSAGVKDSQKLKDWSQNLTTYKEDNFTSQMKIVSKGLRTEDIETKNSSEDSGSTESIKSQDKATTIQRLVEEHKTLDASEESEEYFISQPVNRQEFLNHTSNDEDFYQDSETVLPEDIEAIKKIGSGTFANVYLCKSKKTGQLYALKVIDKENLSTKSLKRYALTEKTVLTTVKSDFIVSLKLSFQTPSHCYLLMDY